MYRHIMSMKDTAKATLITFILHVLVQHFQEMCQILTSSAGLKKSKNPSASSTVTSSESVEKNRKRGANSSSGPAAKVKKNTEWLVNSKMFTYFFISGGMKLL